MRRGLLLSVLLAAVLALSGCGPVTNKKAQKIAVDNLQKKYGGTFVVRDSRSDLDLDTSAIDLDYNLEVYSRDKRLTTHVMVSGDGKRVGDDLEELMYADRVAAEVQMVPCSSAGWVLDKVQPIFHSYVNGQQASSGFEDYKRDAEKIELSVDTIVDGRDITPAEVKAVAASLQSYAQDLQALGYRIRLFIDCNGLLERIDSLGPDDKIEQKQIEETLKTMGAGTTKEHSKKKSQTTGESAVQNTGDGTAQSTNDGNAITLDDGSGQSKSQDKVVVQQQQKSKTTNSKK